MKNAHPIEVLLVLLLVLAEAMAVLITAAVAISAATQRSTPAPIQHPLAALADQMTAELSRRELQQLAGIRSNLSKTALAGMVAACS